MVHLAPARFRRSAHASDDERGEAAVRVRQGLEGGLGHLRPWGSAARDSGVQAPGRGDHEGGVGAGPALQRSPECPFPFPYQRASHLCLPPECGRVRIPRQVSGI